jgi:hypothetical protein
MKFICLFLAIKYTVVNGGRYYRGLVIPASNFTVQALGIAGFIYLQWLL